MFYQVHITTWENDADDYSTQIITCSKEEDVRFFLDLASHFTSCHSCIPAGIGKGLGNEGIGDQDLLNVISNTLKRHPDVSSEIMTAWTFEQTISEEEDEEGYEAELEQLACNAYDLLTTVVLHRPFSEYYAYDENNFCRVFERAKVFSLPELPVEVSSKFGV